MANYDVMLVWDAPACFDRAVVELGRCAMCVALCFAERARAALLERGCDRSRVVLISGARDRASATILAYLQYIEPCRLGEVLVPVPAGDGGDAEDVQQIVGHVARHSPRHTRLTFEPLAGLDRPPTTKAEMSVLSCESVKHLALWQAHPSV